MQGLIPEELVEDICGRVDIVEIISEYVRLEQKGRHYIGLCPFHQETTPSFTVTPEKQLFYCFGCQTGGNVFKFIMLKENLSFPESVRYLAGRLGIRLPEYSSGEPGKYERIRRAHALARDFYRRILQRDAAAAQAREYLVSRGVSAEMQERFELGFAPPRWDALLRFLTGQGFRPRELVQWGLAVEGSNGRFFDRFRNRVIFPVWDAQGRVIGFGGRVMDDSLPKYLNSPETPVFNKRQVLYGMHLARQAVRSAGYAVIMEGYLDVITAHQYGIENAVASLGTSLTQEQGKLILRYTQDVYIAYDADAAGVKATMRGLDILQELGCRLKVVCVPEGCDPDDFLREQGREAWDRLISQAVPLLDYKLSQALARSNSGSATAKLSVLQEVLPTLHRLSSEVEREEGVRKVAGALSLNWETVYSELRKFRVSNKENWAKSDKIAKKLHNIGIRQTSARQKAEAGLLRSIIEDISLVDTVRQELGETFFTNVSYQRIFDVLLRRKKQTGFQPAMLANYLEEREQQALSALLAETPPEEGILTFNDCLAALKRLHRQEMRRQLQLDLAAAEKAGNQELVRELLRAKQDILKTLERGEQM
ncbi:MAG: DNA primase [Peptococcaceae bacterium]|nr:DNA primase [Peptococcaceae bacterium]